VVDGESDGDVRHHQQAVRDVPRLLRCIICCQTDRKLIRARNPGEVGGDKEHENG